MIHTADEALKDCFQTARDRVIEMFPRERRPGATYQGLIKAQKRLFGKQVRYLKDHLRGHHRAVAGAAWERYGWVESSHSSILPSSPGGLTIRPWPTLAE